MSKSHSGALVTNAGSCVTGNLKPRIFSFLILTSSALQAGKIAEVEVFEHGGAFKIKAVAVIGAPASYVREVLTDYMHIYRLNPSIIESGVLEQHEDGAVSVRTRVIGCAAYFCNELERVEKVQVLPSGDIQAEIVPEKSQFRSGQTFWSIKNLGEDSCEVTYNSDVEPDIYIPPVVGQFLIKKSIRQEIQVSFTNLEKISSVLAERDWQQSYQMMAAEAASAVPCDDGTSSLISAGR
jgi:hypothetical protein